MRDLTDENLRQEVRTRIWDVMAHNHPTYLLTAYHALNGWWTLEETEDIRKTLVWMKKNTDDFPFVPRHWSGKYVPDIEEEL